MRDRVIITMEAAARWNKGSREGDSRLRNSDTERRWLRNAWTTQAGSEATGTTSDVRSHVAPIAEETSTTVWRFSMLDVLNDTSTPTRQPGNIVHAAAARDAAVRRRHAGLTAGWIYLNGRAPTLNIAADCCGSNSTYVASAVVVLKANDSHQQQAI